MAVFEAVEQSQREIWWCRTKGKDVVKVFEAGGALEKSGASKRLCTVQRKMRHHHAEKNRSIHPSQLSQVTSTP